jgi:hypothetical protein
VTGARASACGACVRRAGLARAEKSLGAGRQECLRHVEGQKNEPLRVPEVRINASVIAAYPAPCERPAALSYSALNSQPISAITAIKYIHTSSAMPAPTEPYITL